MSTYDKLDTINDSLNDIKTAIVGKGITPSGNITTYATAIANIPQSAAVISTLSIMPTTSSQTITAPSGVDGYSPINVSAVTSSIDANIVAENIKDGVNILGITGNFVGSGGKYHILDRIKDDSNNEIGTVSGFYVDENNIEYAVVCLDAQYRLAGGEYLSSRTSITNLPSYTLTGTGKLWGYHCQSATFNTDKILAMTNYTSSACSHCRSKSFVIGGTTYYGQLPNISEASDIFKLHSSIESLDTSAASAGSTLNFSTSTWKNIWSSTQNGSNYAWAIYSGGSNVYYTYNWKDDDNLVCPVLEIPNN